MGAVERINDPAVAFRTFPGRDAAALFHEKSEIGTRLGKFAAQDLLGLQVGGADEIRRPLAGDLEIFNLAKVSHETPGGFLNGADHHIDDGGTGGHDWTTDLLLKTSSVRLTGSAWGD